MLKDVKKVLSEGVRRHRRGWKWKSTQLKKKRNSRSGAKKQNEIQRVKVN